MFDSLRQTAKDVCWVVKDEEDGETHEDDGKEPADDTTTDPADDARREEEDHDGEDEVGEWEAACMRALRLLNQFDEYQEADAERKKELTEGWSDAIGEILGDGATSLVVTSATALTAAFAVLSF